MNADGPRTVSFIGGVTWGRWTVTGIRTVIGEPVGTATHLDVVASSVAHRHHGVAWVLRGVSSNERYVTRDERERLAAVQPLLGRPEATRAALIPIRKSAAWWAMAQDERAAIFAESQHIVLGLRYLPAIARRLYHSRDLGEPFDFLTWFEYAPYDAMAFERLVEDLRRTEEWRYVEREIDVRLERTVPPSS
jgi:chlorite dismutase